MTLASKLKGKSLHKVTESLWKGPEKDGITQSLLSRYLCDQERARILLIEGLVPPPSFSQRIEYGNMWHVCEEALAAGKDWKAALLSYARKIGRFYDTQAGQVEHWYNVCLVQFPAYVDWWKQHPETVKREPICEEYSFALPYPLASGRSCVLRGKWDSVDLVSTGVRIQENKTKGDIDEGAIKRDLHFDLQTAIYVIALETYLSGKADLIGPAPPKLEKLRNNAKFRRVPNILYNVVRRPLSGGRHSIRQHKPTKSNPAGESQSEFYARLGGLIRDDSIEEDGSHYFFSRWDVDLMPGDMDRFRRETLDPVLENLCDSWEWWTYCAEKGLDPFDYARRSREFKQHAGRHYRFPYGVYNVTLEGGASEYDEYLRTGNSAGLVRAETLFPELVEVS